MRALLGMIVASTALISVAAPAQSIEQLEQLEPQRSAWQIEYFGEFGQSDFGRSHAFEALYGLSDKFALGFEVEFERDDGDLTFDEIGAVVLFRLADPEENPVGLGVLVGASTDGHRLSEVEVRFITEKHNESWWGQGDIIFRRVNEDDEKGSLLAYGWNLSHHIAGPVWLGLEGSGQAFRLGGLDGEFENGHFVGPSLTLEFEPLDETRGVETEIGLAWFRRVGGEGSRDSARFLVQVTF